ncbi:MAG: histidine--tRNA ligase, partial [Candidatus Aenigmarchaeota archaeon]|nr:histidine--tRNA ligase [Candidatus Aenigmarchaeota archaeon]
VGISIGIERILDILKETTNSDTTIDYFVAVVSAEFQNEAIKIAQGLRNKGFSCEIDLMGRNFSNQMKYANKRGAKNLVIVGPKDFAEGKVTLKDMQTGKEQKVSIANIIA